VIGDYETYISQELIREIDGRYRTFTNRENRAITGYSMGGWGALHLGLKFPDVFSVVVSEAALANARGKTADTQERVLARLHPTNLTQWASVPFPAINFEGLLAGLLPEPDQPSLFTGNPYALANGTLALIEVQAQRCLDEDVQHGDLGRYVQQPIRLAALEVVHGTSDSIIPIAEARDFTNALATAGVEFTFQTHTGDHVYLPELALPFLSDHLPGAELYVAPPTVTVVAAPDQLRLTFPTQLGVAYVVESADSFESPAESWTERVRLLGDGKTATITLAADAPTSFFRIRAQNPPL
jgi:pimeloyl-ACP methyl ester carboxylesterase